MSHDISVIVPTFNCSSCLMLALDSIFGQTMPPGEVIVIDDGSTDSTEARLRERPDWSRIRYLWEENKGPASARNAGLAVAKFDWVAFCDADDLWLPDRLERGVELLRLAPNLDWLGGAYLERTLRGATVPHRLSATGVQKLREGAWFENIFDVLEEHAPIHTSMMLIHKRCFEDSGKFNAGLRHFEDFDLFTRIACRHPRMGYVAKPASIYVRRANSLTMTLDVTSSMDRLIWLRRLFSEIPGAHAVGLSYARYQSRKACVEWLHKGDRASLERVLRDMPEWIPRACAGRCGISFPSPTPLWRPLPSPWTAGSDFSGPWLATRPVLRPSPSSSARRVTQAI